jgi:pimeloyl-ACP methyl ester carboxylesterase
MWGKSRTKTLAIRLSAFILLLVLLQLGVSVLFPVEIPQDVLLLEEYLSNGVDVIYLGDSTLVQPAGEVTLGEILEEMLPGYTVGQVAHPAYGLDLFARYVQYIVRSDHRPEVIVVPVNMRSFSPEWDRRPGYQFEEEKAVLTYGLFASRMLLRPLKILGALDPKITQEEFLNTAVYDGDIAVGTVRDFEAPGKDGNDTLQQEAEFVYHDALPSEEDAEALQKALTYYYMFRLDQDHRKLRALAQIARLCDESGIRVIFYITPVNYQRGTSVLGDVFRERFVENVDVIHAAVRSALSQEDTERVTMLDLSFGLEAYAFVDMEHLREQGKIYVADQLAAAIRPEGATGSETRERDSTPTPRPTEPPTLTWTPWPTEVPSPVISVTATLGAAPTLTLPSISGTAALSGSVTPQLPVTTRVPISTPVSTPVSPTDVLATVTVTATRSLTGTVARERISPGTVLTATYIAQLWPGGKYGVDMYRLWYQTLDREDKLVETRAYVYLPHAAEVTRFPVLGSAPGTTGLSSQCAPLDEQARERNWGNYHGYMLSYAAQGYIGVLPNWLGFDEAEQIHPYFVAKLQGQTLLDAVRAVYDFLDSAPEDVRARPDQAVFLMGYSSGGHAVFAAKDLANSYAPELPVKGIIGHGATTNVETLLREDPAFAPYIVYAYRDFYGSEVIDPAKVFLPQWASNLERDVLSKCVDEALAYYSGSARNMYTAEFRQILYEGRLAQEYPLFAAHLAENKTGVSGGQQIPVLLLQGTGDTVVTPPSQEKFARELCVMGTSVTYLEYPAVPHYNIRRESFGDTLSWMQLIADGGTPTSHCADLVAQPLPGELE